jgi:hypothetical protein
MASSFLLAMKEREKIRVNSFNPRHQLSFCQPELVEGRVPLTQRFPPLLKNNIPIQIY